MNDGPIDGEKRRDYWPRRLMRDAPGFCKCIADHYWLAADTRPARAAAPAPGARPPAKSNAERQALLVYLGLAERGMTEDERARLRQALDLLPDAELAAAECLDSMTSFLEAMRHWADEANAEPTAPGDEDIETELSDEAAPEELLPEEGPPSDEEAEADALAGDSESPNESAPESSPEHEPDTAEEHAGEPAPEDDARQPELERDEAWPVGAGETEPLPESSEEPLPPDEGGTSQSPADQPKGRKQDEDELLFAEKETDKESGERIHWRTLEGRGPVPIEGADPGGGGNGKETEEGKRSEAASTQSDQAPKAASARGGEAAKASPEGAAKQTAAPAQGDAPAGGGDGEGLAPGTYTHEEFEALPDGTKAIVKGADGYLVAERRDGKTIGSRPATAREIFGAYCRGLVEEAKNAEPRDYEEEVENARKTALGAAGAIDAIYEYLPDDVKRKLQKIGVDPDNIERSYKEAVGHLEQVANDKKADPAEREEARRTLTQLGVVEGFGLYGAQCGGDVLEFLGAYFGVFMQAGTALSEGKYGEIKDAIVGLGRAAAAKAEGVAEIGPDGLAKGAAAFVGSQIKGLHVAARRAAELRREGKFQEAAQLEGYVACGIGVDVAQVVGLLGTQVPNETRQRWGKESEKDARLARAIRKSRPDYDDLNRGRRSIKKLRRKLKRLQRDEGILPNVDLSKFDVHHQPELQVLILYPGVYTKAEVRAMKKLRLVPRGHHQTTVSHYLRQVHTEIFETIERKGWNTMNPACKAYIRRTYARHTKELDALILKEGGFIFDAAWLKKYMT